MASLPECVWEELKPYKYIDSKDYASHASKINFAPSRINGTLTYFQNAGIRQICKSPYFVFVALRDIEPGEEIWTSYGEAYDYKKFMYLKPVRDFFCSLARIDCSRRYTFRY